MSRFGAGKEVPAVIRPTEVDAGRMLTLPRNEAGFAALVTTLTTYRTQCSAEFTNAAIRNVHDETIRPRALVLSGQVKALNDVLELLDRLIVGGINDGE